MAQLPLGRRVGHHPRGYPVRKKWLSYRAAPFLNGDLTMDEVQEFMRLVRRLAALQALAPALDAVYEDGTGSSARDG